MTDRYERIRDPAEDEGHAITAVEVTLFGRACYLPADIAQEVEQVCAAHATAARDAEIEALRDALEECHALSVERWRRLLAAEAENERLREALREAQPFIGWTGSYPELHAKIDALLRERLSALDSPAPTEEEVLAAAKRAAAANSGVSQEYGDGDLLWSYLDERAQAHWLKVARAALGVQ